MRTTSIAIGLVLAMSACEPDHPFTAATPVAVAVFDPTNSRIPLPNDLVFLNAPNSVCPPPNNTGGLGSPPTCAQAELLSTLAGKFPSDQEQPITIDFTLTSFDADGKQVISAPDLDLATFTPSTFFVAGTTAGGAGEVPTEPLTDADYVKAADGSHGTLTIHHVGHTPWPEGKFAAFVRGGANGVKTKDGMPVGASQVFTLIEQGKDMTDPQNIGLLKAQFGSTAAAIQQGAQLNLLIGIYQTSAFPTADTHFPHQELAILTTFSVGPSYTNVTIDPARGLAPLPIDLLADAATGHISQLAACTFAGSSLGADGKSCATPTATAQAAGFTAIDGFSTTGAILGPTSELMDVTTITSDTLRLYDLSDPAHPVQVPATSFIIEPCEFTSSCTGAAPVLSPVIAIQPSGLTAGDPTSLFRTKPLKDATTYAVVMTNGIKDKAGQPLRPGTVAQILRFTNPLAVGGKSALQGIDDGTAASLEAMRLKLQPVFATLAAGGLTADKVAMAYTFHTQTILRTAVQLAALPYTQLPATALPANVTAVAADVGYKKFGGAAVPHANINQVIEGDLTTFNLLDDATGAFNPDPTKAQPETIRVLIATPKTAAVTAACPGGSPLKCAPMVVFRHGLTGGRIQMLAIADAFAQAGMVTVAIDAVKHGDRAFCTSGQVGPGAGCNVGVKCESPLPQGAQGDDHPPGKCADGKLLKLGLNKAPVDPANTDPNAGPLDGVAAASGNYLITANFFRTRDSNRQDLIDESQLIRAIAFAPAAGATLPTGHPVFDAMAAQGAVIDPTKIYYVGQSLGSIQGTMDIATNPRISRAVLNVGGGTQVDIFNTAPAFAAAVAGLFAQLGVDPKNDPAGFLKFLTVAKTVLDPADPINYAGHVTANTLPNLLPPLGGNPDGSVKQAPKQVLAQIANCDNTVPNPTNLLFASNLGVGPLPTGPAFFSGSSTGTFQLYSGNGFNPANFGKCGTAAAPAPGAIPHAFLLDPTNAGTATGTAQAAAAAFLVGAQPQNSWEMQ
ncbi:MAG TPA: hypothetical protein VFP84_39045 [Kofleriaceae bacterium]|nr:hypothetical protein [Kofleriaceae bacterium]